MQIFLIRHGESIQNAGENFDKKTPDHKVSLTESGMKQVDEAGKYLKKYIEDNKIDESKAIMWVSPYLRTRQTAEIINKHIKIKDVREDFLLIEQRYGLFSDNPIEECKRKYPEQFALYDKYYQNDGKFYAKLPQGESPYDVAVRMRIFLETIFRDYKKGSEPLFIVLHGTTLRAFLLSFFHYKPEWFNSEPNMNNCSIRLIDKKENKNIDMGYIFGGCIEKKIKKEENE